MDPIKPFYLDLTDDEIEQMGRETAAVLRSGMLILGPRTASFEKAFADYVGTRHAVATNTGTSALEILLRIADVKGRTVLVPTNTNFATAAAVLHAGGKVRFVDMDAASFAPSLAQVEAAIAEFRHAPAPLAGIMWVHIGGVVSADFPAVVELCRRHGLFVFEDSAHAHGSKIGGTRSGALADGAAFSFFPTKVMTTFEGGMITTNDERTADLARSYRNQGKRGGAFVSYHSDLGNSWRIGEVGAALGLIQLAKLDAMLERRQAAYRIMTRHLRAAGLPFVSTDHMEVASQYKLIVLVPDGKNTEAVKEALKADGVICGGGVYDTPCHLQPVFADTDPGRSFPVAETWCPRHICPPLTSGITEAEAEHVGRMLVKHLA
ncbi:MAG: aminotransferase class I/II-fold pyridoxal phosphate-dependent enzyme [Geminicoccaceae bacterium]